MTTVPRFLTRFSSLALVSFVALSGCGAESGSGGSPAERGLRVVATTTHAADLARSVGGSRVEVVGLLPANADPHDYEVRPRDVEAIAEADVVVRSGGELDEWLAEAIEASGGEPRTVNLIEHVRTIRGGDHGDHAEQEGAEDAGEADPHWWQNPRNAALAVAAIAKAFERSDPEDAASYARNASRYSKRVLALDRRVAACMRAIPAAQRKLVTTHDALGYFANRYAIEVVGTVIPSLSTRGQPSAGETAELVKMIRRERARAVFAEEAVSSKLERAIAQSAGATVGEPLLADTLAPKGRPGDTYIGATALNAERMAAGFTGDADHCDLGG